MRGNRLRKFISTNPWLKLASICMAVLLWFFVVSQGRTIITLDVPVQLKNIPAGLKIIDSPTIGLSVEGYERFLRKLRSEDISVVLDLSGAEKGEKIFSISEDNVELPNSFSIIQITPHTVKLLFKEEINRDR